MLGSNTIQEQMRNKRNEIQLFGKGYKHMSTSGGLKNTAVSLSLSLVLNLTNIFAPLFNEIII